MSEKEIKRKPLTFTVEVSIVREGKTRHAHSVVIGKDLCDLIIICNKFIDEVKNEND